MPKIVFIEPKAPNLHIFSQFQLPRLGLFILGTIAKQEGWDVDIIVEESQVLSFSRFRDADLVGISTITSTAPRAYAIADRLRASGVPVILGGPHVTFLPDEALEHADYTVRGEGESALRAFLRAWETGGNVSSIPNLSHRTIDGRIVHNPMGAPETDLDRIPYPAFSVMRHSIRRAAGKRIIPVQTSRGCPFDCAFCSVTGIFGKSYRHRSTDNVMEELRQYDDPRNFVFFYDDNFTADRERAKVLLRAMIEERFRFKWSTQVRIDAAKDSELVRLMKMAGCFTLFIGLESVNPASLVSMKKHQTVEDMESALRVFRRQRIHVHGMFVYGFDEDDWDTVERTVAFAKKNRLTSTQFLILTPLPGSELYDRMVAQKRIQFGDWSLYDAHHAVFQPANLSMFDLQRAQIYSHRQFYSFAEMGKKWIQGRWMALSLARYAWALNRLWQKRNATFLKVIDLLRPKRDVRISVDYRENVLLD